MLEAMEGYCKDVPLPPGTPRPLPISERKSIFIARDYSRGLSVAWSAEFPAELVGIVDERTWMSFVKELNERFAIAEKTTSRSVFETCLGLVTCYLIHPCMTSSYDVHLEEILDYIDDVNEQVLIPRGVYVSNPMDHGMRVIEVVFLYIPKEKANPLPTQPLSNNLLPR